MTTFTPTTHPLLARLLGIADGDEFSDPDRAEHFLSAHFPVGQPPHPDEDPELTWLCDEVSSPVGP